MGNYVFLGPPGAGKGTMAGMVKEEFGCEHVSTGDILRAELKQQTELGLKAKSYMESGALVPDKLVAAIISKKLAEPGMQNGGFVLDGYPRTVNQAQLLDAALTDNEMSLDAVVLFDIDRDLLVKRLTARRICPDCGAVYNVLFGPPTREGVCDACGGTLKQRPDDTEETVVERLDVYESQTAPLIAFYETRRLLVRTPGDLEKAANYEALKRNLGIQA
mgnify:CR=1 FL=1